MVKQNISVIVGSPKGGIGNSESIADFMIEKLVDANQQCSKIILRKEFDNKEALIEHIINSDTIIITFPIYENSVPGMVLNFFEFLYENKSRLSDKLRRVLFISNSGYSEPMANQCAINCCRIFAEEIGFSYMGGFGVSPGTLIDGKKLEATGGTYKKLMGQLTIIAEHICNNEVIPEKVFGMVSKPLMSPFVYRFFGKMIQNGDAKKMGKEKYYAQPLLNK